MHIGKLLIVLLCMALFSTGTVSAQDSDRLRAMLEAAQELPLEAVDLPVHLPEGQELGMVSWVARDPKTGLMWLLQRGDKADPVIAVDKDGRVVHSFGRGLYGIPHAIRLDPQGNIWTVDAATSTILQFSPEGKKLLQIDAGGPVQSPPSAFRGTTDIAFGPKGRIFISDGYANARILEYTATGKKVREWGTAGAGPGEFHLPHSIAVDENTIYVADRENGRIERFSLDGKFLSEIPGLGRTYSLKLGADGALWAGMQPLNEPTGSPGWLVKFDRKTGGILGYVRVTAKAGLHSVEDDGEGHPITGIGNKVVCFRNQAQAASSSPVVPAELKELTAEIDQISKDGDAIDESLNRMKEQQSEAGLNLRADVTARQESLEQNRFWVYEAVKRHDAAAARKFMDRAWQDIKFLHEFLGR